MADESKQVVTQQAPPSPAGRQAPPSPEPPKPSPPAYTAPHSTKVAGPPSDDPNNLDRRPPLLMYPGQSMVIPRVALSASYPLNANASSGIEDAKRLGIEIGPAVDYHDPRYHPTEVGEIRGESSDTPKG